MIEPHEELKVPEVEKHDIDEENMPLQHTTDNSNSFVKKKGGKKESALLKMAKKFLQENHYDFTKLD